MNEVEGRGKNQGFKCIRENFFNWGCAKSEVGWISKSSEMNLWVVCFATWLTGVLALGHFFTAV